MFKISTRITLWYALSTGVTILIMASVMYNIFEFQRRKAIDEDLIDFAETLVSDLPAEQPDLESAFDRLIERKERPSSKPRTHRFALSSRDSIIYEAGSFQNLDSILNIAEDKNEFSFSKPFNTVNLNGQDYRTYSHQIKLKHFPESELIVFTSMERLNESLVLLRQIIFLVTPFGIILAVLIGYLIARLSFRRVRQITETASAISVTNLDLRVPVGRSQDELSELASTFNNMINRLDSTFKSQQRFIADASHDIRTPLTVIQMELELILEKKNQTIEFQEAIERALKEVSRLNYLSDNLLILARADANQLNINKKILRLDELLLDCLNQLYTLAKSKNISYLINLDDAVEANVDESLLKRVFYNIIENAIKYSPENNKLTVVLSSTDKAVIIKMKNYGMPIPEQQLEKIFDRFQRGDKARTSKGFGLGLAIVQAIVKAHDGTVNISSNAEDGTIISLSLPL
ncbi:MAG: ATP-binding protein [Candidatus Kapabacteria bacterium]|nr:ATP-binding protein [Candidatus Kapabacteria bacterium]